MSLDDLLKSLEVFNKGMAQYQTTQAVNDATQQLNELSSIEMDRQAQLQAQAQIGNQLALRLTGAGAQPQQIAAATEGLIPSASSEMTNIAQSGMQDKRIAAESQEKKLDRDLQRELADKKITALGAKGAEKQSKFITDYQKRFNKESEKVQAALQNVDQIQDVLATGNPIGDQSLGVFFARAAGEVGNLNQAEQDKYGGAKSIIDRLTQIKSTWESGKLSSENRKYLKDLASTYRVANGRKLEEIASKYADQAQLSASRAGYDFTYEEMLQAINPPKRQLPQRQQQAASPNQAAIQQAEAWLAANPNDPKAAAVQAKIKKMKGQ